MMNIPSKLFLIFILLASLPGCALKSPAPDRGIESFSLAFLSDTHIMTADIHGANGDRTQRLIRVLEDIKNRPGIDFIILGGDLVEDPNRPEQFDAFDAAWKPGIPWYPIPGNHDIGGAPDEKKIRLWLDRGYGRGTPGREYYGFVHKGAAFFILNTFADQSPDPGTRKRADKQLEAMDLFFITQQDCPFKFVCGHAPLFLKHSREPDEYFNIKSSYRSRIIELMKKHRIDTYLSGHRHGEYRVSDPAGTGITVYTQTALSWPIGEGQETGYSIFTISPDGLMKKFIPVK